MEELFLKVSGRLAQQMPELTLIDEDCGQLQLSGDQDEYPVTFPCVLIDMGQIDWQQNSGALRGRGNLVIKLAFDCYEDTHYAAGTTAHLHQRLDAEKRMRRALHQYCFGAEYSPMQLVQSRFYSIYGRKKVYESTFSIRITEDSASTE